MTVFFGIFLGFLAVCGAVELIGRAVAAFLPREAPRRVLVTPSGPEDCELLVRAAAWRLRWDGGSGTLLCARARDPETEMILRCLRREYPFLVVLPREDGEEERTGSFGG